MEKHIQLMIAKELEQFHCSVLLDEVRDKVRRLKVYGVKDVDIIAVLNEKNLFPKLIVTTDLKILIEDNRQREVVMEPLVKSIYLLFLKHPEGIVFKELPDYRQELTMIYSRVRPWKLTNRALQSIEDVTNPLQNSINEKCARIRGTFVSMLGDNLAAHYYINGQRGEAKKISLPRDLVLWE